MEMFSSLRTGEYKMKRKKKCEKKTCKMRYRPIYLPIYPSLSISVFWMLSNIWNFWKMDDEKIIDFCKALATLSQNQRTV